MTKAWLIGVFGMWASLAAGCATTPAQSPRMVASGQHLVIEVEGKGSIDVGPGTCGDEPTRSRCEVDWTRVSDPILVAEAAPGWRFERWEAPSERAGDGFDDPSAARTYRAIFVPTAPTTARRETGASH